MTVGSRGPAKQDSSGKRQEWISLQLQPLKLTDTSNLLSHVWEQQRAPFLEQTSTIEIDFDPRFQIQVQSEATAQLLESKISTTNPNHPHGLPTHLEHCSVVSDGSSEFQEQVTQRNRQRLLSTWLAHRQEKHLSQDWTKGESKHTGPCAVTQNQLVEGLG